MRRIEYGDDLAIGIGHEVYEKSKQKFKKVKKNPPLSKHLSTFLTGTSSSESPAQKLRGFPCPPFTKPAAASSRAAHTALSCSPSELKERPGEAGRSSRDRTGGRRGPIGPSPWLCVFTKSFLIFSVRASRVRRTRAGYDGTVVSVRCPGVQRRAPHPRGETSQWFKTSKELYSLGEGRGGGGGKKRGEGETVPGWGGGTKGETGLRGGPRTHGEGVGSRPT